jgi:hypothetical protein
MNIKLNALEKNFQEVVQKHLKLEEDYKYADG